MGDRLTALLLAIAAGLGAIAWWLGQGTGVAPDDIAGASPQKDPPIPVLSMAKREIPALVDLAQTVERPLFSRTRLPPPVETAPTPGPEPTPVATAPKAPITLELSAVILEPDRRLALFRQAAQDASLRAVEGQTVDGWLLKEVRADSVLLERDGQTHELALRTFKPAPVVRKAPATRRASAPVAGRGQTPTPPAAQTRAAQRQARAAQNANAEQVRRPRRALRGPRRRSIQRQRNVESQSQ